MAPEAAAHSGSLLCQLTGIHTNPPAGFLLLWLQEPEPTPHGEGGPGQGGPGPRGAGGTPQPSTEHPQTQPGEQKEEGGGLPFEGRLCLVCRDEKVPMTAPMAAKTCVRLGTSGPAPPLHWKEISVDLLLRIGGGKKKAPRSSPQLGIQRAWGWGAGSLFYPSSAPHMH